MERFNFLFLPLGLIVFSSYAMDASQVKPKETVNSLRPLKDIVAKEMVTKHYKRFLEILPSVSQVCKVLLARAYYHENGYDELPSLFSSQKIFVRKADYRHVSSDCFDLLHYRATRQPENPFLVDDEEEKATFAFMYKEEYFDLDDRTNEMIRLLRKLDKEGREKEKQLEEKDNQFIEQYLTQKGIPRNRIPFHVRRLFKDLRRQSEDKAMEEHDRLYNHWFKYEFLDYRNLGKPSLMHNLGGANTRGMCAGPNKNGVMISVERTVAGYIPSKLDRKGYESFARSTIKKYVINPEQGQIKNFWEVGCFKPRTDIYAERNGFITAVALSNNKNVFFVATDLGKIFYVNEVLNDNRIIEDYVMDFTFVEFPIQLESTIVDMRVSSTDECLWILTKKGLYYYHFETRKLTLTNHIPSIPSDEVIPLENGELIAKEDVLPEEVAVFTLSPNEKHALLGGTEGTVLLADLETANCYIIDKVPPLEIADIWWNTDNHVVILSRSGTVSRFTMGIGHRESCSFKGPEACVSIEPELSLSRLVRNKLRKRTNKLRKLYPDPLTHDVLCPGRGLIPLNQQIRPEKVEVVDVSPNERYAILICWDGSLILVDLLSKQSYEVTVMPPQELRDTLWDSKSQLWIRNKPYNTTRIYKIELGKNSEEFLEKKSVPWNIDLPVESPQIPKKKVQQSKDKNHGWFFGSVNSLSSLLQGIIYR